MKITTDSAIKNQINQIAAQIILQSFIEAGYPEDGGYLGPLQG